MGKGCAEAYEKVILLKLDDTIMGRRSVRVYSGLAINDKAVRQMITAAINAPSACDVQGWRFIVLNDKKVIDEIVKRDAAVFIRKASVNILVLYDNTTDNIEYKDNIQSASAAIQNMILKAYSLGIGSCWVCHLPRKRELRRLLGIPSWYDPIAMVALGHYDKLPPRRPRKKTAEQVISYNHFDFKESPPKSFLRNKIKRIGRKIYYLLPFRNLIRKRINNIFEKRFESHEAYEEDR